MSEILDCKVSEEGRVKAGNIGTYSSSGTLGLCIPVIEVKVQTIKNIDLYDRYA